MAILPNFFENITSKEKSEAIDKLITHSSPRTEFFLMVTLSILMATFGLLINNAPVVIGSMLIAPVLFPVLSFSMGIVISDQKLISRSLTTLFKSLILAMISSFIIASFFSSPQTDLTTEILARTKPTLLDAAIAVVAGLAASFAFAKPQMNETLPGIAISVALVPPLAVTGIGIARFDWLLFSQSLLLFFINSLGIIFSSMIVFSIVNFYTKKKEVAEAINKEEKEIKAEKKPAPTP